MSADGYGKIESEDMSRLYDVYISKNVLEIMMQFKAVYFSTIPVMDVFLCVPTVSYATMRFSITKRVAKVPEGFLISVERKNS